MWPLSVDLVIGDDLVLCLLHFHHLAELGGLVRMISVDGSNRLTSLPSLRVLPRKMRALVCFITCLTSGTISSSSWRSPSSAICFMGVVACLTPWTISAAKRFACPTTLLVVFKSWP